MILQEINDSILNTNIKYIVHCVNCIDNSSNEVIFEQYPEVKDEYRKFCKNADFFLTNGPEDLLGTVLPLVTNDNKIIFNLFTQEWFGFNGEAHLDHNAIKKCFRKIVDQHPNVKEIAIQRLTDFITEEEWNKVKNIIDKETQDKLDVYVYYL